MPKRVTVILSETETIFLLDFASSTTLRDTDDGKLAEEDNRRYDDITNEGVRANRKITTSSCQTIERLLKTRYTEAPRVQCRENSAFASEWVRYDSHNNDSHLLKPQQDQGSADDSDPPLIRVDDRDDELSKLFKSKHFQNVVLVIERLLANNCYNEAQKRFKGLLDPPIFTKNRHFKYNLRHLWTFSNNKDNHMGVIVDLSLNHANEDIIAVGYGKYYFEDKNKQGFVLIWNIKNPQQPERQYIFPESTVTCMDFAHNSHNLLAVGFYNGAIKIVDICEKELCVVASFSDHFETVWSLKWLITETDEQIIATFKDGFIRKFQVVQQESTDLHRLKKCESKLKGLQNVSQYLGHYVPTNKYASIRCITYHKADIYFVGTLEGVLHKMSTHNRHSIDKIQAHEGPINGVKFSPFSPKLYATYSDDFRVCLWADGVEEPLLQSRYSMQPVLDLDWSPIHSTILVSLRGRDILMWDLQRKFHLPQSKVRTPTGSRNSVCRFTRNGRCLFVGDFEGCVHVFILEDMPIPPFFQEDLLRGSLRKVLTTRPDLMKQLT